MKLISLVLVLAVVTGALFSTAVYLQAPRNEPLPQVVIVYAGEKGDLSFIDSTYRGVFRAQEAFAFDKQEFTAFDPVVIAGLLAREGPDRPGLVITASYAYDRSVRTLAREYPGVMFLGLDLRGSDSPNLRTCEIASYGSSYLAGVLAASATRNHHVGVIAGTRAEILDPFLAGYRDGARAVDPAIVIDEQYVQEDSLDGFNDPGRAEAIARSMYGSGADVIYNPNGFSVAGVIREAKRAPGRYVIGVDSDQTDLGPAVVLASMVKHTDRAVYDNIGRYLNGTFAGGDEVVGLRDGATEIVFNPKFCRYEEVVQAWEGKAMEAEARYLRDREAKGNEDGRTGG